MPCSWSPPNPCLPSPTGPAADPPSSFPLPLPKFRRWYLPSALPVIQATALSSPTLVPTAKSITKWTRPGKEGGRSADEAAELHSYLAGQAPTMPLMFREIERRLDHVVFRGGFADSLETARGLIGMGAVRLNGNVVSLPPPPPPSLPPPSF